MNREPYMLHRNDHVLVDQVCKGDLDAFRILVERHQRYAYQIAFRILRSHPDAEDVSQEAFMKIYENMKNFRREAKFSTYLYRIVVNLSLNVLRKKRREKANETSPVNREEGYGNGMAEDPKIDLIDIRDHLQRAIQQLSRKQQAVLVLRHFEGMSTREVSKILNCSEGTVKQQLHRAMLKLQKFLHYMRD